MTKNNIIKLLSNFSRDGCFWELRDEDYNLTRPGVVDRLALTRFNGPDDFFVLVTLPGFQEDSHFAHSIYVKRIFHPDSYQIILHDYLKRSHTIEKIDKMTDREYYKRMIEWRTYKKGAEQYLDAAFQNALKEHTEIARQWK